MTEPATAAPGNGLDSVAQRHFLRNALMIGLENAGFVVAIAFVGTNTMLPTFIVRLGGSTFLVGLAATCQTAGWLLPQLLGAGLLAGKTRIMPNLLKPLYIGRPLILVIAQLGFSRNWAIFIFASKLPPKRSTTTRSEMPRHNLLRA